VVLNQRRLGVPETKNRAASLVRGEFVTWLDGDDRFLPDKLEHDATALERCGAAAIAISDTAHIDAQGERLPGTTRLGEQWDRADRAEAKDAFKYMFAMQGGVASFRNEMVRRSVVFDTPYDATLSLWHDWDLRIRLTSRHLVTHTPRILQEYRLHTASLSRSSPALTTVCEVTEIFTKNREALDRLDRRWRNASRQGVTRLIRARVAEVLALELHEDARRYFRTHWRSLARIDASLGLAGLIGGFAPSGVGRLAGRAGWSMAARRQSARGWVLPTRSPGRQ
jgi:hypothetical protein